MKTLIYVEPWIQMGSPFLRDVWVFLHSYRPIEALNASESSGRQPHTDFRFVIGDSIDYRLGELALTPPKNVSFSIIKQHELWRIFPGYKNALRSWFEHTYSQEQLEAMSSLLVEKLSGYTPDIIISFTPAPFLQHVFPDALVLYKEYGIFSRPPYPESWFLDCCGIGKESFLVKYQDRLSALQPTEADKMLLESVRGLYLDSSLRRNNQFQDLINNYRKRYSALVLLPLQVSDCYMFYCHCDFSDQFEFLCYVLHNMPDDVGVVVTEHPDFPQFTPEQADYIRQTYGNFIYHPEFRKCYGVSQFLLDSVDGVVTVSSSVGLQALLWGKPLFVIGNSHLSAFSETVDIRDAGECLEKGEHQNRDGALAWLLTHYYISERYYWNGAWLYDFLTRSVQKRRNGALDFNFYAPVDNPKRIATNICNSARLKEMGQPLNLRLHPNSAPRRR